MRVRLRLLKVFAFCMASASILLILIRPDLEGLLRQVFIRRAMPDAFNGLNQAIPLFVAVASATSILAVFIEKMRQQVLWIVLLSGPLVCLIGWAMKENFDDPNWLHLFVLTSLGMFVSCTVTGVLLIGSLRRPLEDSADDDSTDEDVAL